MVKRCDLLSNLYFCIGWYTCSTSQQSYRNVVICFQICIFVLGDTPLIVLIIWASLLWFAFKFVFLYWVIHRFRLPVTLNLRCDLLSNLYFCIGWYTSSGLSKNISLVVICFQICIFVLGDTPCKSWGWNWITLWFAFKFVFLYWVIHRLCPCPRGVRRCDLLSNLYFCIGWYTNSSPW